MYPVGGLKSSQNLSSTCRVQLLGVSIFVFSQDFMDLIRILCIQDREPLKWADEIPKPKRYKAFADKKRTHFYVEIQKSNPFFVERKNIIM